jgi:hypothetical protein
VIEANLVEGQVELVGDARDGLALEQSLGHVEGVHHVGRGELDVDRLADRQDHLGDGPGAAQDIGAGARVGEPPAPLEGGHLDGQGGLGGRPGRLVLSLDSDHEQDQHDQRRDQRPGQLQRVVTVGLCRQLVVAAPVADHRPDQQP